MERDFMMGRFIALAVALAAAPLLPGLINKTKAAFAGRQGPPVLQLYFDILKGLGKGAVYSRVTTGIFRAGAVIPPACALMAAVFVPFAGTTAAYSFEGDVFLYVGLFSLGRFFTVAAAWDTGSPFEGMGAAREVAFALFAELALFIGLAGLAQATHSLSLSSMAGQAAGLLGPALPGSLILIAASFFVVSLAENCRIPVDDPATHLELTMIHEVMVLDHGGPDLAFILYGASLKLFLTLSILAHILFPMDLENGLREWLFFAAAMAGLSVAVGLVESGMARLRLVRVPRLLMAACVLATFGMILGWK